MHQLTPAIATVIDGKYELLEHLGSGAMGTIFLAEHLELGRKVALKFLSPDMLTDREARIRFEREARLLSSLHCANLVQFHSWGFWQGDQAYMVMEFLEGTTLGSFLEVAGALSWNSALKIAIEVCKGLEAIHSIGAVHRDLSMNNIFVCNDTAKSIKIIDLGLASIHEGRQARRLTESGALLGSLNYVSPEVCAGRRATACSDIYSLGCILYELIAGEKAFQNDTPAAVIYMHTAVSPKPLSAPNLVVELVCKSLSKRPEERFQTAEQFRQQMEAVLQAEIDSGLLEEEKASSTPRKPRRSSSPSGRAFASVVTSMFMLFGFGLFSIDKVNRHTNSKHLPSIVPIKMRGDVLNDFLEPGRLTGKSGRELETGFRTWLGGDSARLEIDNSLYLADCYLSLARSYIGAHDAVDYSRMVSGAQECIRSSSVLQAMRDASAVKQIELYNLVGLYEPDAQKSEEAITRFLSLSVRYPSTRPEHMVENCKMRECVNLLLLNEKSRALAMSKQLQSSTSLYVRSGTITTVLTTLAGKFDKEKFELLNLFVQNERIRLTHKLAPRDEREDHAATCRQLMQMFVYALSRGRVDVAKSLLDIYEEFSKDHESLLHEFLDLCEPNDSSYKVRDFQQVKNIWRHLQEPARGKGLAREKACELCKSCLKLN